MGRLKMMCLCLEGGWVNTYSPRFFWLLQQMDPGSVGGTKGKRTVGYKGGSDIQTWGVTSRD